MLCTPSVIKMQVVPPSDGYLSAIEEDGSEASDTEEAFSPVHCQGDEATFAADLHCLGDGDTEAVADVHEDEDLCLSSVSRVNETYLPREQCQSAVDGRNGSNACVVIATRVVKECFCWGHVSVIGSCYL